VRSRSPVADPAPVFFVVQKSAAQPYLVDVVSAVAQLLLDLTDRLEVSGAVKRVPSEEEEFDQVSEKWGRGGGLVGLGGGGAAELVTCRRMLPYVAGRLSTFSPRNVPSRHIQALDEVLRNEALVDGHDVSHAVASVAHDSSEQPLGVQREHGLDGDVGGGEVVGLEHVFDDFLAVGERVLGGLGEQDLVLGRINLHLLPERVVPELQKEC